MTHHPITRAFVAVRTILTLVLLESVQLLAAPTPARAQCQQWIGGPFTSLYPGVNGVIYASTTWDPDGSGPRPELLVVGGSFTHINGVDATNIAAWDGVTWRPLGLGVTGTVRALAIYNGTLVVAGGLSQVGGITTTYVGRWNDSYWQAMGTGMFGGTRINALTVHNGQLYAGGDFNHYVLRWDNPSSTWVSLAESLNDDVYALASFGGYLYAGGKFTAGGFTSVPKLGRYDGYSWWGPGHGPDNSILTLGVINNVLYAGGDFNHIDFDYALNHFVAWDGSSWLGVDCGNSCGLHGTVRCITSFVNQIHVGGDFWQGAINGQARRVARLFDGYWRNVGSGIGPAAPSSDAVYTLAVYHGELIVGGSFSSPTDNLARWNGSSFADPIVPATVRALAPFGSRMAIGGAFQGYAPDGDTYNVVSWNGTELGALGSGTNAPVNALTGYTESLNPPKYRLVVGGEFTSAGGLAANSVALWTESDNILQTGWSPMGAGFNGPVMALTRHSGRVVAGGIFTQSGLDARRYVARWDGTAWQAMGTGMNNAVFALKTYQTTPITNVLVAGGGFTQANGNSANFIALWVSTENVPEAGWNPMGAGFNNTVYAVERYSGSTYAAGAFTASGATPLNRVARFVSAGSSWVAVGTGFDNTVRALWVDGGFLYAAGDFTGKVARWNGSSWAIVDGGTNGSTVALASFHGEVLAGGSFTTARASATPAVGVARFLATGIPWFVGFSWPQTVGEGGTATFRAEVADGYGPLTWTWRRNGVPLYPGGLPGGGAFYQNDPAVSLHALTLADSGYYDCTVSNACGGITGGGGQLTVTPVAGVGDAGAVAGLQLAAGPNPFSRAAEITFRLAEAVEARVRVFDARGRLLRELATAAGVVGAQRLEWDGRDGQGREVPSGIYFLRLEAGPLTAARRLVRLR